MHKLTVHTYYLNKELISIVFDVYLYERKIILCILYDNKNIYIEIQFC